MSTFNQMVARVQALVASHSQATSTIVGTFVNSRHRALLESYDWSRRKQDVVINTAVDKDAGTVALTSGSAAVAGTSTAFAATDVGRSIQFADSIYTVATYTNSTTITLGDANGSAVVFPGTSVATQAYTIFTQRYSLGQGIEQIISVKYQGEITEVSEEYLDSIDPSRSGSGTPLYYARTSRGANDDVRIELYPRALSPISVNVKIERGHVDLVSTENPLVPSGPVEWWAAVDTCYFLTAKTKDPTWLQLAQSYEKQATKSEEFEHNQDNRKFGVIGQVRDVQGTTGLGATDFALDKDI